MAGVGRSTGNSGSGVNVRPVTAAATAPATTTTSAPAIGEILGIKAADVDAVGVDGTGSNIIRPRGRPSGPTAKLQKTATIAPEAVTPAADAGVRLESLGKGTSTANVDEKTNQVVIRRSGRVIERFEDDKAVAEYTEKKKLSEVDRETMAKLSEMRRAEPEALAEAKSTLGPDAGLREPALVNAIASDADKNRIRAEVERTDAETYAWVERQRKLRVLRAEPAETEPIAAAVARQEAKGDDSIEKESTFSSPNARRTIPPEIGSRYVQAGEKYYHPNNTKAVAFVDRGDKLETPSSAPKTAEALVKIAEARGWEDLRVKGTEGFRREVWLEASVRGIHVDGYKPSELDKVELERRDTFLRDRNSIEVRSEAFQKLSPEEGTRRDPTLANAYAVIQAAKAFAKERIADKAQQSAFIGSTQAKVVADLEAGRTTPTVNLRAAAPNREVEQPRNRDQRRDRER